MFGHGRHLRAKINLFYGSLGSIGSQLWNSPQFEEVYKEYLIISHQIVRASVPLLVCARDQALKLPSDDPLGPALADYLAKHIEEEHGHDQWVLRDLKILGVAPEDVLQRVPLPAVAEMVGAQYYYLYHYHLLAILSYIAVLEGNAPTHEQLEEVLQRTGLPRSAFNTMAEHATLDQEHAQEADDFLDGLPLSPDHVELLGVAAIACIASFKKVLEGVLRQVGQQLSVS